MDRCRILTDVLEFIAATYVTPLVVRSGPISHAVFPRAAVWLIGSPVRVAGDQVATAGPLPLALHRQVIASQPQAVCNLVVAALEHDFLDHIYGLKYMRAAQTPKNNNLAFFQSGLSSQLALKS